MTTPVEDKLVVPPEYIHEAPIPTTHIQYINKPAYNLVDFINDNIQLLSNGTINFLIGQDAYTQGYQSIMLLFYKLFDNKNPDSKFAYTDIVIKNRFNI